MFFDEIIVEHFAQDLFPALPHFSLPEQEIVASEHIFVSGVAEFYFFKIALIAFLVKFLYQLWVYQLYESFVHHVRDGDIIVTDSHFVVHAWVSVSFLALGELSKQT